jgi:hypothetical protein
VLLCNFAHRSVPRISLISSLLRARRCRHQLFKPMCASIETPKKRMLD